MTTECAVDGNPADGAVLCGRCADHLAGSLRQVPGLVDELTTTIAKLDRRGEVVGKSGSDEQPLIYNDRASDIRLQLRDRLGSWVWAVAEHGGLTIGPRYGEEPTAWYARWLLDHPGAVRHYPAAGDLYEEVTDDVRAALSVIDRPPDTVFAGRCECGGLLYARPGAELAYCRCGLAYGVEEQRVWMLGELSGRSGTSKEVSQILAGLGIRVPPGTIRRWAHEGRLFKRDGGFRAADVVALITG